MTLCCGKGSVQPVQGPASKTDPGIGDSAGWQAVVRVYACTEIAVHVRICYVGGDLQLHVVAACAGSCKQCQQMCHIRTTELTTCFACAHV
jgi:hypothetical protein